MAVVIRVRAITVGFSKCVSGNLNNILVLGIEIRVNGLVIIIHDVLNKLFSDQ